MLFNLPEVNKALFRTFAEHIGCELGVEGDFARVPGDPTDDVAVMCRTHGRVVMVVRRDGSEP